MQLPTPNLSHSPRPNLILISSQNRTAAMSNLLRALPSSSTQTHPDHLPRFRETFPSMILDSSRVWFYKTLISYSPSESSTTIDDWLLDSGSGKASFPYFNVHSIKYMFAIKAWN
ncbi:hypothetical protein P8452_15832 [Trifolium repens]|nr:hypothetical protein P8452_15832 [Trifolium repens]